MSKTDLSLGMEINNMLIEKGIETPLKELTTLSDKQEINNLHLTEKRIQDLLDLNFGLDLKDDSLKDTPKRVSKMYIKELFKGLSYNNFPKITTVENKMNYDSMLVEQGIQVKSICEHHFMPISGQAIIGYIPNKKVIGLSKLNRIVDFFSRRPQIQERLTHQIYQTLCYILGTENVGVIIKAEHFCVKYRGIEDPNCLTTTSKLGGLFFNNSQCRQEFLSFQKV